MEIIRAIQLRNKGAYVARLKVKNSSGAVVSSRDIVINNSATIDLNQYLNKFNDGDTITVGVEVVAGRNRTSTRQFIYRAGALEKAIFEVSGTTLSSKLRFIETKTAYEYHINIDEKAPININGINYILYPEDSIAMVNEPTESYYKGVVKIPRTITYQKKKYVVTQIGNQAFGYCKELTSVTLPSSICFIGDFIFIEDSNLKTLRVETDTPPSIEVYSFQEFYIDGCTLYVPLGSVEIYKNTWGWKEFKNIKAYLNRPLLDRIDKMIGKIRAKYIIRKKLERPQK